MDKITNKKVLELLENEGFRESVITRPIDILNNSIDYYSYIWETETWNVRISYYDEYKYIHAKEKVYDCEFTYPLGESLKKKCKNLKEIREFLNTGVRFGRLHWVCSVDGLVNFIKNQ